MSVTGDSASEFGDDYLSDEYQSSDDPDWEVPIKRTKIQQANGQHIVNWSRNNTNLSYLDKVDKVIDAVVRRFTDLGSEDDADEDDADDNKTDDGEIIWDVADGSSLKRFHFTENDIGIKSEFYEEYKNKDPYDFFKIFVTDSIVKHMARQTNMYAKQTARRIKKSKGHVKAWIPTNCAEMEKFLGIILWMGLMKLPRLKAYWSTSILYATKIKHAMPRHRFEQLLQMWYFNGNKGGDIHNAKLRKLTPLVQKLTERFQYVLKPGSDVCIDETLVPFRGCLESNQYRKDKRHITFGIKMYKLCTSRGYTYNLKIYCGKTREESASTNVVFSLMDTLLDTGRTLYTDDYYTSVSLASQLLQRKTHLVGTVRSNRKYNSKSVVNKELKKNEVFAEESGTGIVMLKWRDTHDDVLMLSTQHKVDVVPVRQRGKEINKPQAVIDYNKSKSCVDLSDQLESYSHCLGKGTKWYRKLAVELIFGPALVNSYLMFKDVTHSKISITEYKEKLALTLLKKR
ncbi:hypothetical protein ILUMI_00206 [Ignelater luminosus]|uniref:PiggyBac transposable element-derived protein domain-containing protein n=1 Tax=Ignelater luminosus TaxID=2038154 RepID=A0A8K0DGQ2_IGNLU|nr:hypothetical protein ILUMI_00206 [Ignelater luminosus]